MNGKVALIWNHRDETSSLIQEYAKVNANLCLNFKGFSQGFDTHSITYFFKSNSYESLKLTNSQQLTQDQFIGRALSSSYAPKEQDDNFDAYVLALTKLFIKYQKGGSLQFPEITTLYFGEI